MAGLAVRAGDQVVPLGDAGPFVVGRARNADFPLNHPGVSREHLVLTGLGTAWSAFDMGTDNGTYHQGRRIGAGEPIALEPGMELVLGHPERGVVLEIIATEKIAPRRVQLDDAELAARWEPRPRTDVVPNSRDRSGTRVISVGRRPSNDLVLADPTVSGRHALLAELKPGCYLVEDLRSTNGTFVDGVVVRRQEVGEGSTISFGKSFFEVTNDGLALLNDTDDDPEHRDPGCRLRHGEGPEPAVELRPGYPDARPGDDRLVVFGLPRSHVDLAPASGGLSAVGGVGGLLRGVRSVWLRLAKQ